MTVLLGANADGTDLLQPLFIGQSKQPRRVRGVNLAQQGIVYTSNKKVWIRSDLFAAYLTRLDARFHQENRKVLMLMDNVSFHKTDDLRLANIQGHKIAPNTMPNNQPLDAGVIHAFKAGYARRRDAHAAQ